ncbi:MAG: RagB/SusD family nutrient uptake outer membrane protein [Sphingobacterium sp.]|nr:RagB/SusD family nutrient uptake outer membrane protein [Sphingobacterium sp.]
MSINKTKIKFNTLALILTAAFSSCEKFVQLDPPPGSIEASQVYNSEGSATAAVLFLYSSGNMRDLLLNTTLFAGLAADELNYQQSISTILEFQNNNVLPTNGYVGNALWLYPYNHIVNANAALKGLENATLLSPTIKNQLLGEVRFWRALAFFNLVNCYGAVPLAFSDAPTENAMLGRTAAADVYKQILDDLLKAKDLVGTDYLSANKSRVNKTVVSALLARVYLYQSNWAKAEEEATIVINNTQYKLSDVDQTFKKSNTETILQIETVTGFTQWGVELNPASSANVNYTLAPGFIDSFEANDLRKINWTKEVGSNNWYHVNKYKLRTASAGDEYYIMFRLAELYLIRAEARAQQNNLTGTGSAEEDLNKIRTRAELSAKLNLGKPDMLLAIEQERKVELFGEYAHRWFDLKRTASASTPGKTRADDVLSVVKGANWQSTDILFPISENEINKNPNLLPQNEGYN